MSCIALSKELPIAGVERLQRRREDEGFEHSPYAYARRLASYIRDASTIRARTLDMFGHAPSLDSIRGMVEFEQRERKARSEHYYGGTGLIDDDGRPWKPRSLVQPLPSKRVYVLEPQPTPGEAEPLPLPETLPALFSPAEIIESVAKAYGQTKADMMSRVRTRRIAHVRSAVCYVLKQRGNSFPQIGRWLGGRDHSTIIDACERFEDRATATDWAIVRRYFRRPDDAATLTESND